MDLYFLLFAGAAGSTSSVYDIGALTFVIDFPLSGVYWSLGSAHCWCEHYPHFFRGWCFDVLCVRSSVGCVVAPRFRFYLYFYSLLVRALTTLLPGVALLRLIWTVLLCGRTGTSVPLYNVFNNHIITLNVNFIYRWWIYILCQIKLTLFVNSCQIK